MSEYASIIIIMLWLCCYCLSCVLLLNSRQATAKQSICWLPINSFFVDLIGTVLITFTIDALFGKISIWQFGREIKSGSIKMDPSNFKRLPRPGWQTWNHLGFIYFLSHQQRLRPLCHSATGPPSNLPLFITG